MDKEEVIKKQQEYYDFLPALFEIVKCLYKRELSFISPKKLEDKRVVVRFLLALNINYLKKHLKWVNYDRKLLNMYQSVAKLNEIPVFSYNLSQRLEDPKYKEFNENYEKYVIGYDLFLDLDGKEDFNKCYEETKEIKKLFDEYKLPYYIINSSFKGFHFHIPCEYMPDVSIKELLEITYKIMYNLKGIYSFSCLDLLSDLKRICKVPYSMVGDGSICLPLSDIMFDNFKSEMVSVDNVLHKIMIKNRGLLLRTHGLDFESLKLNVLKFINDFR